MLKHRNLLGWFFCIVSIPVWVHSQPLGGMARQLPFSLKGNFSANTIGYHASGIQDRMPSSALLFSVNATASMHGVSVPLSLRLSNRNVAYSQPFNQFGFSPSYQWATAHVGYRNVNFSSFTLAGHTFLGGGLELNPGKVRAGLVYGRFKKSTTLFEGALDTTQTLARKGYGVRLGAGSEQTFVDLIFLNIRDDSASIPPSQSSRYLPAEENAVVGINSRIRLSRLVSLEGELAASLYTTDLAATGFSLSEDTFLLRQAERIVAINHSSELLTAVRGALKYQEQGFSTQLEYRRIDPGYRSMGAYFINNDIQNFTVAPAFSLFNHRVNLRGSLGLQRDNLRNAKRTTSRRTISSVQASFNPTPVFGLDVNVSNYSSTQRAGRVPLIDSLKFYQTTRNLTVSPRWLFTGSDFNHLIIAVFTRMALDDKNSHTRQFTENQATVVSLNYSLTLLPYQATALFGMNYNRLENYLVAHKSTGFTLGASKSLLQGQLNAGLNQAVVRTEQPQGKDWTINTWLNSGYRLSRQQSLRLSLYFIRSVHPQGMGASNFNEIKGDLGYVYTFN